jgi:hypothetical protein
MSEGYNRGLICIFETSGTTMRDPICTKAGKSLVLGPQSPGLDVKIKAI